MVVRWPVGKGGRVVRWQYEKDGSLVRWKKGRVQFFQGWRTQGECKISSSCL